MDDAERVPERTPESKSLSVWQAQETIYGCATPSDLFTPLNLVAQKSRTFNPFQVLVLASLVIIVGLLSFIAAVLAATS